MRRHSCVPAVPASQFRWTLGGVLAGLLVVAGLPADLRADTILNSGTTTVSSGTDFGSNLYVGTTGIATLEVIAGGYAINTTGYLGSNAGGVGTATVSSGTWASSGYLFVGNSGSGTLTVNGGSVTNTTGYLGNNAGSVGTATVSSGTWANSGYLYVGNSGTGMLTMSGGSVTNSFGWLGYNAGSVGAATVSSGTWATAANLHVGWQGTGALNVAGGYVSNSEGYLGFFGGSVGTASVSSGTWANSSSLYVGNSGSGTLTVNGGYVGNSSGLLGNFSDGVGTATVSSGTWANSFYLYVANYGNGTLNVSGGSVTNNTGYLGYNDGSVGTATVSSGTWANSGNLTVGSSGTGTLAMSGGLVTVGGTLSRGGKGTINLNSGGTLQIGVGGTTGVLGVDALTNNGRLIFNRSDASTYSGVTSGTGAVTKQGAGTLTLDGANSYTGVTTISGGVLALSGSGSIGTGGLNIGTTASPGVFDLAALISGTYFLPATGDLAGVGTLSGDGKTLAVLGSFMPGNSPGIVTLGSGFTLDLTNSGTSVFEITSPLYTANSFDLVNGTGSVVFGGILSLDFSGGSYSAGTNVLQLFANSGGLAGNFSSVVWSGLADGQSASFDASTGLISIAAVPEPTTYAMALAGLACGGYSMWRRQKRSSSRRLLLLGATFAMAVASTTTPAFARLVNYELVPVGDPGNAPDTTGYGAVNYSYQIGKYEVTIQQYTDFLNTVASSDPYSLYKEDLGLLAPDLNNAGISRVGSSGSYTYSVIGPFGVTPEGASSPGNRPITFLTWFDAARFANWMQNGQGSGSTETGAYTLGGATTGTAPAKNPGATFYIPTENEWYKAAYYSPVLNSGSGGYFTYATQSNTAPGNVIGSGTNQANYFNGFLSVTQSASGDPSQNYLTDVGAFTNSASFYGTFDQSGNMWEWNDLTGAAGSTRGLRGGVWGDVALTLSSVYRLTRDPSDEGKIGGGFRLASPVAVPEPSTWVMVAGGITCASWSAWRRRKRA